MRLRYRAICRQGCGVLHLTDLQGAAGNVAGAHRIAAGHQADVEAQIPAWPLGRP